MVDQSQTAYFVSISKQKSVASSGDFLQCASLQQIGSDFNSAKFGPQHRSLKYPSVYQTQKTFDWVTQQKSEPIFRPFPQSATHAACHLTRKLPRWWCSKSLTKLFHFQCSTWKNVGKRLRHPKILAVTYIHDRLRLKEKVLKANKKCPFQK